MLQIKVQCVIIYLKKTPLHSARVRIKYNIVIIWFTSVWSKILIKRHKTKLFYDKSDLWNNVPFKWDPLSQLFIKIIIYLFFVLPYKIPIYPLLNYITYYKQLNSGTDAYTRHYRRNLAFKWKYCFCNLFFFFMNQLRAVFLHLRWSS